MQNRFINHNRFKQNLSDFYHSDPHLYGISQLKYQYEYEWWKNLALDEPGIYIVTGGRQIGKSTSCKQLIKHCLKKKLLSPNNIFYLPCDEVYDAKELSQIIRLYLSESAKDNFLLVIDEVTFVENWDRVIKALADEGFFRKGICLLTGSDTLILKEAAMRFPGRRGNAETVDFHLYPLSFSQYSDLVAGKRKTNIDLLGSLFQDYLKCGGFLRPINDLAVYGEVTEASYLTYEQWIRGDLLKRGKNEATLLAILRELIKVGVSQVSYNKLTQKVGSTNRETLTEYLNLLERMDIIFNLQAYDQNTQMGFPRKDRKFHFNDPFIQDTIQKWLIRESYLSEFNDISGKVEACVASHCRRSGRVFYYKGQGEIDIIWLIDNTIKALEVKWSEQVRRNDLKMLKHFENSTILTKLPISGKIDNIISIPVYKFLKNLI